MKPLRDSATPSAGVSGRKKVLLVSASGNERGGVQVFLTNWIRYGAKERYDYTWYFPGELEDMEFYNELLELGVRPIMGGHSFTGEGRLRFLASTRKDLAELLRAETFDVLHVNTGGIIFTAIVVNLARRCGIPERIVHSHNSGSLRCAAYKRPVFALMRPIIVHCSTRIAACSKPAAESLVGNRAAERARIVHNCIDAKRFAYCDAKREACRRKYGLEDCFVIGHVGRLSEEKNQGFLIEALRELLPRESSARLLLVGSGSMEAQLRAHAAELDLTDRVVFAGTTNAPQDFYSAMDAFVLPSAFEGFPLVSIEAQANGLPCLLSDGVPDESRLTDLVSFLPLAAGTEAWAERILEMKVEYAASERSNRWTELCKAGYDISNIRDEVLELYEREDSRRAVPQSGKARVGQRS